MGFFTTLRRASDSSNGRGELSTNQRGLLPDPFVAVAEALVSGGDTATACEIVGRELAKDGADLGEALHLLDRTWQAVVGHEPGFSSVQALSVAWSEETLGYLHQISCEDPLTGLASLPHLRARLSETYRAADLAGVPAGDTEALVVVDIQGVARLQSFEYALVLSRAAELIRTVFQSSETIARVDTGRLVVRVERSERLGRQVGLLDTLIKGGLGHPIVVHLWIEGLPGSEAAAAALLDELTRH